MANGTSGIGSSTPIYSSLQPQVAAQNAAASTATQLTPDQQLQALVQAAQGGDPTAIQVLNQLQGAAGASAQPAGPAQVAPGATSPTDSFTPATATTGQDAASGDPTALLDASAGDSSLGDGTGDPADPAAAAKDSSSSLMGAGSDLARYMKLSGDYKGWKISKNLMPGQKVANTWSQAFKPGGGLSKLKGSADLAQKLDAAVAQVRAGRSMGLGPAVKAEGAGFAMLNQPASDASKLEKTFYKLNNNNVARGVTKVSQGFVGKVDSILTRHVLNKDYKQAVREDAKITKAKVAEAAAKAEGTVAKETGGFFGAIGRAFKPVGNFFTKHAVGLKRLAVIGAVINGVTDTIDACKIIADPNTSLAKKFFSLGAVAGDAVGALPVPGAARLVGDGISIASAYGRDHS